jgi:predicted enzyme related to lactoylglutathione lyase
MKMRQGAGGKTRSYLLPPASYLSLFSQETEMDTTPAYPIDLKAQTYQIVTLGYVSLYVKDLLPAITFYSQVFGPPHSSDVQKDIYGWRMGSTWLTLLPSKIGTDPASNPRNTEFAIQVAAVAEVDRLYHGLIEAGAKACMAPEATRMYEPMRFACVDDPFGMRIDIYCPLPN